jgi:predicted transcriptional regulator
MAKTTTVSFSLTPDSIARLDALAEAAETSRSWLLRRILEPVLAATNPAELTLAKPEKLAA